MIVLDTHIWIWWVHGDEKLTREYYEYIQEQESQGFAMPTTVQEVYDRVVCNLSPIERLRLATLILNDLVQQNLSIVAQSDTWSEQDRLDVTTFALQYAATLFPENEEI